MLLHACMKLTTLQPLGPRNPALRQVLLTRAKILERLSYMECNDACVERKQTMPLMIWFRLETDTRQSLADSINA
ncbi:hypothetical protein evm_009864 [Chilo suppressalis]|nr:hypothetical protein evm_009864 [Chilo suppressalis]